MKAYHSLGRSVARTALHWAHAALAAHLLVKHGYAASPLAGPSMLPTLAVRGDWVVLAKRHARGRGVRVGDVVSLAHPRRAGARTLKRVLALPGDYVLVGTPAGGAAATSAGAAATGAAATASTSTSSSSSSSSSLLPDGEQLMIQVRDAFFPTLFFL